MEKQDLYELNQIVQKLNNYFSAKKNDYESTFFEITEIDGNFFIKQLKHTLIKENIIFGNDILLKLQHNSAYIKDSDAQFPKIFKIVKD